MVSRGRLLFAALPLLGVCIVLLATPVAAQPEATLSLERGSFLLDGSLTPPPADRAWEPVMLPDLWRASRPGVSGAGWYRFRFPASPEAEGRWGVYLPRVSRNASVFLNGRWIGEGGPPGASNWNRPLYFPFSRQLLVAGENELAVRLETFATPEAGIIPIEVGPHSLLEPRWRLATWLQVRVAQFSTILAVFFGLLFAMVWLGKSRDPVYGYFALVLAFWGLNSLDYHLIEIPLPFWDFRWLIHAAADWIAIFFVFLVSRLASLERPRFERAVLSFGIAATVVPGLAHPPAVEPKVFEWIVNTTHLLATALMVHCLWTVFRYRQRLPVHERWISAVVGIGMNVIILRDLGIRLGVLPDAPRLFQFAAPLMFLAFGSALLLRFIEAYKSAEDASRELEARIEKKEGELLLHYERVRELEGQQILASERERITREMHDGMGGQLVSTLAMVEAESDPEAVADALRSSLDEMRLVIHSLDPLVDGVENLLALTRDRVEPRLRRRGIRFAWQVGDLPPTPSLGPEQYLHLMRVLQEAITNAVKHADASVITVSSGVAPDAAGRPGIFVRIADDGLGIAPDRGRGCGLENMEFRAGELGGRLRVEAAGGGTCVEVWFPVQRAASA